MKKKNKKKGFFKIENDSEKEWREMPEYKNDIYEPQLTIKVHLRNEDDIKKLSELLGQNISMKTKSIWFPKLHKGEANNYRYTDES